MQRLGNKERGIFGIQKIGSITADIVILFLDVPLLRIFFNCVSFFISQSILFCFCRFIYFFSFQWWNRFYKFTFFRNIEGRNWTEGLSRIFCVYDCSRPNYSPVIFGGKLFTRNEPSGSFDICPLISLNLLPSSSTFFLLKYMIFSSYEKQGQSRSLFASFS